MSKKYRTKIPDLLASEESQFYILNRELKWQQAIEGFYPGKLGVLVYLNNMKKLNFMQVRYARN